MLLSTMLLQKCMYKSDHKNLITVGVIRLLNIRHIHMSDCILVRKDLIKT